MNPTSELPDLLPSRRTALEVRNAFPAQLQFGGFCPVTYVQAGSTYESLEPGLLDFAFEYDGQLYGLRNAQAATEFMELRGTTTSCCQRRCAAARQADGRQRAAPPGLPRAGGRADSHQVPHGHGSQEAQASFEFLERRLTSRR